MACRLMICGALGMTCFALQACRVAPAGKLETTSIQWAKHHLTVGGKKDVNPIHSTAEMVEQGKKMFSSYCVVCHGRDGQNTGVPFAASMSPAIPPLSSNTVQSYDDGQLKWIIENGIRPSGMPASKGILSDRDMWTIVVYLRHLPPAGSLGQPRAYSEDEYAK